MSVTFEVLFCGAGGDIAGLKEAGMDLVLGANHWERAIETVSSNHPEADFLCVDINHYDMRRLPRTDVLWASVICTEISPAGGNKKRRGQGILPLEELGHVPNEAYERTRACALDVVRATEVHRYSAIVVENVVEFARDWELYDWWIQGMCSLGYEVQTVNVSAAHVYDERNAPAPQWRDRIYIVFTRKGVRKPFLEPRPRSWCERCDTLVEGVQSWKRLGRRIGKYGQQYLYRCSRCNAVVEPLVLPALAALDLADVGERIGDRSRPLAPKTLARIQWGLENLSWPVIAQVAGNTFERPGYHRAWSAADSPLMTRQATGTDAICGPALVNHASFYVKNFGGNAKPQDLAKPLSNPLGSITTRDHHALVIPYRRGMKPHRAADGPLGTQSTHTSEGVLRPAVAVEDCHYRTLKPREHLRAQRFVDAYRVAGNQGEQTMQAGNAVPVNVAHWIGKQLMEVL